MNKPQAHKNLIPIRDYAKTVINRRGFPVSVQYIYRQIAEHKKGLRTLNFKYVDKGRDGIWIVQQNKRRAV